MAKQLIKVEKLCGKCGTLDIDGIEHEEELIHNCEQCGSKEIVVYVHERKISYGKY